MRFFRGEHPDAAPGRPGRAARRRRLLAPFLRDRNGATAIEFTLLAIPFAALVFAILESCISFAAQQVLADATDDLARQLRTGQLKKLAATETELKKRICDKIQIMVAAGCPELELDLRKVNDFATAAEYAKITIVGGKIQDTGTVDPGLSMDKNILRVFYRWPVMTDFMRDRLSNIDGSKTPGRKTLHFATVTWQNEPFDD